MCAGQLCGRFAVLDYIGGDATQYFACWHRQQWFVSATMIPARSVCAVSADATVCAR